MKVKRKGNHYDQGLFLEVIDDGDDGDDQLSFPLLLVKAMLYLPKYYLGTGLVYFLHHREQSVRCSAEWLCIMYLSRRSLPQYIYARVAEKRTGKGESR